MRHIFTVAVFALAAWLSFYFGMHFGATHPHRPSQHEERTAATEFGDIDVWIAPNGNNQGNGSESAPWKTLLYALDQSSPSGTTTINVLPGIYAGQENAGIFLNSANLIRLQGSGSSSVTFDCGGQNFISGGYFYTISGLTLVNCRYVLFPGAKPPSYVGPVYISLRDQGMIDSVVLEGCDGVPPDLPVYQVSGAILTLSTKSGVVVNVESRNTSGSLFFRPGDYQNVPFTIRNCRIVNHNGPVAISAYGLALDMRNCSLYNVNSTSIIGGDSFNITGCTFLNCSGYFNSWLENPSGRFYYVTDSVFMGCSLRFNKWSYVLFSRSTFQQCIPFLNAPYHSLFEARWGRNNPWIIQDCSFVSCGTLFQPVFNGEQDFADVSSSIFSDTAGVLVDFTQNTGGFSAINCTFSRLHGDLNSMSPFMMRLSSWVNFTNCTFLSNSAVISVSQTASLILLGGSFIGNNGVIINSSSTSPIMVSDCSFESNFGGSLQLQGSAIISWSNFTSNQNLLSPGVIYVSVGGSLNISHCRFIGNSGISGGSVASEDGILVIEHSFFESNFASSGGGALMVSSKQRGSLVLNDVIFNNNTASAGGAIFCNNTNVTVSNLVFGLNRPTDIACVSGSCVWPVDLNASISCGFSRDTLFVQPLTNCSDIGICGIGYPCCTIRRAIDIALPGYTIALRAGVFAHEDFPVSINKSNLTIVSYDGSHEAVVDCLGNVCFEFSTVEIDATVVGLQFRNGRPAVAIVKQASPMISGASFTNCSGAFHIVDAASPKFSSCNFDHCGVSNVNSTQNSTFTNCSWTVAEIVGYSYIVFSHCNFSMSSIQVLGGSTSVVHSLFTNSTSKKGGGIYVGNADISVSYSSFSMNVAADGGAILIEGGSTARISFSNFTSNQASAGGAVLVSNSTTLIHDCNFLGNLAFGASSSFTTSSAGAVGIFFGSNVTIVQCSFTRNTASSKGGALFCFNSNLFVNQTEIFSNGLLGNTAVYEGGALSSSGCNVSFLDSALASNNGVYGGAIYSDSNSIITVNHSKWWNNTAPFGAAAYFSPLSEFRMFQSWVFNHSALLEKGPIVIVQSASFITQCNFSDNVGQDGGAVWMLGTEATFEGCSFTNNSAVNSGGAIAAFGSTVLISGGVLSFNGASLGGALHVASVTGKRSSVTLDSGVLFSRNTASGEGGAVSFVDVPIIHVSDAFFQSNTAFENGGNLYITLLETGSAQIVRSNFSVGISTTGLGGGVYFKGNNASMVDFDGCNFVQNCAKVGSGGGFYLDSSRCNMNNCTFLRNVVGLNGGAFAASNSDVVNVTNCVFVLNNASQGNGGAVFLDQEKHNSFLSCSFQLCSALYGGAIFFREAAESPRIVGCNFTGNAAEVGGGGFFFMDPSFQSIPWVEGAIFVSNSAIYGKNMSSAPKGLNVLLPPAKVFTVSPSTEIRIEANMFDAYGQVVDDASYTISLESNVLVIQGSTPHNQQQARGVVTFNGTRFSGGQPYIRYNCSVKAFGQGLEFSELFVVVLTECGFGTTTEAFGCIPCETKSYSFDPVHCFPCPRDGPFECATTSDTTYEVEAGLWILPNLTHPRILVTCPTILGLNQSACKPLTCDRICGNSSCLATCQNFGGNQHCIQGYTGARCTQCSCPPNNESLPCYFRGFSDDCRLCNESPESYVLLAIGIAIGVVLFVCIVVFEQTSPILLIFELSAAVALIVLGVQGQWFVEIMFMVLALTILATTPSVHNGAIKILLFYVQVTNVLVRTRLWPDWFETIAAKINIANIQISGFQCLNRALFTDEAFDFGMQMIFPWILVLCVGVIIGLRHFIRPCIRRGCRKRKMQEGADGIEHDASSADEAHLLREKLDDSEDTEKAELNHIRADLSPGATRELLIKTVIFVLYVGYFELTNQILSVYNCVHWELPDPTVNPLPADISFLASQKYMAEKPWIMCDFSDATYIVMFAQAVVFTIIYIIGIPAAYAYLLWRNRQRIRQEEHIPWLSFLFEDYKTHLFWFELLWMARRVLLSVFVVTISQSDPFQPFFITFILSASLAAELHLQPFKDRMENFLEAVVVVTLLVSYGGSYGSRESGSFVAFQWFVAVLNALVLVTLLITVLWPFIVMIRDKLRHCKCKRLRKKQKELVAVNSH